MHSLVRRKSNQTWYHGRNMACVEADALASSHLTILFVFPHKHHTLMLGVRHLCQHTSLECPPYHTQSSISGCFLKVCKAAADQNQKTTIACSGVLQASPRMKGYTSQTVHLVAVDFLLQNASAVVPSSLSVLVPCLLHSVAASCSSVAQFDQVPVAMERLVGTDSRVSFTSSLAKCQEVYSHWSRHCRCSSCGAR